VRHLLRRVNESYADLDLLDLLFLPALGRVFPWVPLEIFPRLVR
jgi:hypothetical protein